MGSLTPFRHCAKSSTPDIKRATAPIDRCVFRGVVGLDRHETHTPRCKSTGRGRRPRLYRGWIPPPTYLARNYSENVNNLHTLLHNVRHEKQSLDEKWVFVSVVEVHSFVFFFEIRPNLIGSRLVEIWIFGELVFNAYCVFFLCILIITVVALWPL